MVVGLVWPASLLAGAPTLYFNQVLPAHPNDQVLPAHPNDQVAYCMLSFPQHHHFYLRLFKYAELAVFYVGPLVVQVVLYALVSRQLFMGSDKLHRRLTVLDENGMAKERWDLLTPAGPSLAVWRHDRL